MIKIKAVDRMTWMVSEYGEATTKSKAARIVNVAPSTIMDWARQGKIRLCCDGEKVDVRSLAEYIDANPNKDKSGSKPRETKNHRLLKQPARTMREE